MLLSPKDRTELEQFLKLFGRELSLRRIERNVPSASSRLGCRGRSVRRRLLDELEYRAASASFPTDRWARTINDSREGAHIETGGRIAD